MWFERDDLCQQWLSDLISAEMSLIRSSFRGAHFTPETLLNSAQSDIDSIELVDLASSLFLYLDAEQSGALGKLKLGRSFADWLAFAKAAARMTPSLGFFSSGSSGTRKLSTHSQIALQDEVRALTQRFSLQNTARVICAVPTQHIYGFLFGTLLPAELAIPCVRIAMPSAASVRVQLAQCSTPQVLVATPKLIEALARDNVAINTPTVLLSAGSALSNDLFGAARGLGFSQLIDIYGSAETAGIATRVTPGPFSLLPRYSRQDDHLWDCYARTRAIAPDQLRWSHEGNQFELGERLDRQVQVAGVNVCLSRVESVLRSVANVIDAHCFLAGKASSARIHARVVVAAAFDPLALHSQMDVNLISAERPTSIEVQQQA
jgi:4-coumarate--CoA ligase (photoactive yellow protein activation family)